MKDLAEELKVNTKNNFGKVDVVFTGQIRTPERFKESINEFKKLQKSKIVDKIIFSTWDYEIDKYGGMRSFLEKNKIILVEKKEPKNIGPEIVIWYQMISLEHGLLKASKKNFVFKTRPDLLVKPSFLKKLLSSKEKLKITYDLPFGNEFKYKIWIPYFEITKPFYMSDECFFGHYEDIRKLYNYDELYDKFHIGQGMSHIRRFIHPFLKDYKIFDKYLERYVNVGLPSDNKSKLLMRIFYKIFGNDRFGILRKRLRDPEYLKILAAYYSIIYSHFHVDATSVDRPFEFGQALIIPKVKMNTTLFEANFTPEKKSLEAGQIYSYNLDFLEALFNDKFKKTYSVRILLDEIRKFKRT